MSDLPDRPQIIPADWMALRQRLLNEVRTRMAALHDTLDELTSQQRLCEIPPRP